ncbi:MAG: dTDP-4-dehydrorhamnose 3,5-epimerase family protein [Nitrospinota bacterium]
MNDFDEIEGVIVQPLKQIEDPRGSVLHMLKKDSELFSHFGEIYFSEINPGVIKAWKRHKIQSQNITVPVNRIRLVIFDSRSYSKTQGKVKEYEIGRPDSYQLVHIPPMLWYGFQTLGEKTALIANCPDLPHDPAEAESASPDSKEIPYQWKK